MFGKHVSDTGLISRIYKEYSKNIKKKASNPIQKVGKDLKRRFTKEDRYEKMLNIIWH